MVLLLNGWRRCASVLCGMALSMAAMAAGGAVPQAPTPPPTLFEDFATGDGALTVFAHGDYVEPYFALNALLVAHRLGVDVQARAAAFARWLLPYQQADGRFVRICRSGGAHWRACGPVDADDSLAVFWCLLVNEVLKGKSSLQASCGKSLHSLAALWDPQRATFRARRGQPEAYFADNVEVIGALDRLRADPRAAAHHARELDRLPSHTQMLAGLSLSYGYQFGGALEPLWASLPPGPYGFYPNAVAPVYVWIYDLGTGPLAARNWAVWRYRYGQAWLAGTADDFPWGLIAWAAYKLGDTQTAAAWLDASTQWRQQGRWNLLEEGVRIGLQHALAADQ